MTALPGQGTGGTHLGNPVAENAPVATGIKPKKANSKPTPRARKLDFLKVLGRVWRGLENLSGVAP